MTIRKLILVTALVALAAPSLALADHEHRVTVLMRNGERLAGLLEDVDGGDVVVRASLHDQRKLGLGNIALIDLVGGASGLPETELSAARGPGHLVLLRDGSSFRGQFVDVSGGEATAAPNETHHLIFRTSNGEERRIPLDTMARVYLGNFPGGTTAAAQQPAPPPRPHSRRVRRCRPAPFAYRPTPDGPRRHVRKGDRVRFDVRGRVQLSDDVGDVAESAGSLRERRANGSPLPQHFAGALIGRIGNSAPFPIGNQATAIVMPADGTLDLGINDDEMADNRGGFTGR